MTFLEVLLVIISALVITSIFYYVLKSPGPWGTFWSFLLILVLAGLAAEAWVTPFGPTYFDVVWGPTIFVIFLFALLLAAATPSRREKEIMKNEETEMTAAESREVLQENRAAAAVVGLFFWVFIIFLFIAAIAALF
jgi:hypothetical protein